MVQLITAEEFANFRNISKKIDKDKIDECIKLAQSVDLYDALGGFLYDVISNKDSASYADLMTGSTFTVDGYTYIQDGIKSLLADLAYARFVYVINTNHTPFGMVQKLTTDSQPLERNFIKDLVKQAQVDADVKFQIIKKYLIENSTTFTRFCSGEDGGDITTFSQRFSIL